MTTEQLREKVRRQCYETELAFLEEGSDVPIDRMKGALQSHGKIVIEDATNAHLFAIKFNMIRIVCCNDPERFEKILEVILPELKALPSGKTT